MDYAMVDATIVKVHRYGQGAKGDSEPGHRPFQGWHDHQNPRAHRCARQPRALHSPARPPLRYARRSAPLNDDVNFGTLIADKAFDSNAIVADLNDCGAKIVISHAAPPLSLDAEIYKWRHLIETSSASSKSSSASLCVPTKPTRASTLSYNSQQPS